MRAREAENTRRKIPQGDFVRRQKRRDYHGLLALDNPPWATGPDPTLKNEGWGTRKTVPVTRGQMLNHGVTQMYLTRKIRRSRIFTGRAIMSTRSTSVVTIWSRVMRRKIRCEKPVEFITR